MKTRKLYILFLAGILIFLSSTAYLVRDKSIKFFTGKIFPVSVIQQDHSKIIKFNHKLHLSKDIGVACKDCHTAAASSESASDNLNPFQKNCADCHDVKDEKNCNFCHYNNQYKKLEPTVKELNFSHKYHIETQKKECTDCHKGLDQVKYAKESPTAFPPMETCASCHNMQTATINCEACHTNLTGLTPKSHLQTNFLNEHKVVSDLSTRNNCMMCHSDNFCQVCHSPSKYMGKNDKDNFYAPYYSKEGALRIDREDLQKLTAVHDLNYKYTHGLDANQKSFECKTCHEQATFCGSCHQDGKGEVLTGILPSSHSQPNFTTLGVNTGGGLHADLARKDIEQCQSCHDVEGGDPICVRCHLDNDGIKGTNPKTHEAGFLHDEHGIWHDTKGAVCYMCHTDPNARPDGKKGIGFCGYCHN
jgi:hypothetical protein